jgi:hypothetical protein
MRREGAGGYDVALHPVRRGGGVGVGQPGNMISILIQVRVRNQFVLASE